MKYEEKYKEALKVIESLYNVVKYQSSSDALLASQTIEKAFPELKESEDERIRRELIKVFENKVQHGFEWKDGIPNNAVIAWLEKQGEQKPNICHHEVDLSDCSEEYRKAYYDGWNNCNQQHAQLEAEQKPTWSEEDEQMFSSIIEVLEVTPSARFIPIKREIMIPWLKSLKDRVQPQIKQEWSEYDKIQLSEAIQMIEANGTWIRSEDAVKKVSNWLKSLKPQPNQYNKGYEDGYSAAKYNHWKPSE